MFIEYYFWQRRGEADAIEMIRARFLKIYIRTYGLESTKTGESVIPSLTSLTTFCWFIPLILIILQT